MVKLEDDEAVVTAEMSGWQPIETAPKDRVIDLLFNGVRYADCEWDEVYARLPEQFSGWAHHYAEMEDSTYPLRAGFEPTHWMDRPARPFSR